MRHAVKSAKTAEAPTPEDGGQETENNRRGPSRANVPSEAGLRQKDCGTASIPRLQSDFRHDIGHNLERSVP